MMEVLRGGSLGSSVRFGLSQFSMMGACALAFWLRGGGGGQAQGMAGGGGGGEGLGGAGGGGGGCLGSRDPLPVSRSTGPSHWEAPAQSALAANGVLQRAGDIAVPPAAVHLRCADGRDWRGGGLRPRRPPGGGRQGRGACVPSPGRLILRSRRRWRAGDLRWLTGNRQVVGGWGLVFGGCRWPIEQCYGAT